MLGKTCEKNDEFALLSLSLKWGGVRKCELKKQTNE